MPLYQGTDNNGNFYQFGLYGHKYYYQTKADEKRAKKLALKQGLAIYYSQQREHKIPLGRRFRPN